jgi:RNA polymerase sigma-70 factor (ECF subfamily)
MTRLFLVESSESADSASAPGGTDAGAIAPAPDAELDLDMQEPLPPPAPGADRGSDRDGRLRGLVDGYVDFVARVLRNAGTPQADVDDDVQRTFIIAARRLDDVRPGSEKSFLLQTALNVAAHARRTLARRREVAVEQAPERFDLRANPEQLADQKRVRQLLDQILSRMTDDLRTVFVLYEFEEMSMAEIADALGIPAGTVASRLRRARADFRARVGAIEGLSMGERLR